MASCTAIPQSDFSIAILGRGGVGKTSLLKSFLGHTHNDNHIPTVDDYYIHTVNVDGSHFTVSIVDTAGSYSFPVMRKLALNSSHGFIVVYALDNTPSFKEALRTMEEISELRGNGEESVPVTLVGNKLDIDVVDRVVTTRQGVEALSTFPRLEGEYIETSAKVDFRVTKVFLELLRTLIYNSKERERKNRKTRLTIRRRKRRGTGRRSKKQKHKYTECNLM